VAAVVEAFAYTDAINNFNNTNNLNQTTLLVLKVGVLGVLGSKAIQKHKKP